MTEVDFALVSPCPRCGTSVRRFSSATNFRPWFCAACLKERIRCAIEGRPYKEQLNAEEQAQARG